MDTKTRLIYLFMMVFYTLICKECIYVVSTSQSTVQASYNNESGSISSGRFCALCNKRYYGYNHSCKVDVVSCSRCDCGCGRCWYDCSYAYDIGGGIYEPPTGGGDGITIGGVYIPPGVDPYYVQCNTCGGRLVVCQGKCKTCPYRCGTAYCKGECREGCPENATLKIRDNTNSNRYVGAGQTLKMVKSGSNTRMARIDFYPNTFQFATGYPSFAGSNALSYCSPTTRWHKSGAGNYSVRVQPGANCEALSGRIEVVDENRKDLSGQITVWNEKINTGLQSFSGFLRKWDVYDCSASISLGGSAEYKRVDMYGDGSAIGKYFKLSATGSGGINLPEFEFPIYNTGIFNICLYANLGHGGISGNISILYDESKVSPVYAEGSLKAGLKDPALGIRAQVGFSNYMCAGCGSDLALKEATFGGDVLADKTGVYFQFSGIIGPISGRVYAYYKKNIGKPICSDFTLVNHTWENTKIETDFPRWKVYTYN